VDSFGQGEAWDMGHGTCLNIDFHKTDRGGESEGGCDRRL
jgi:hypothetical protein